MDAHEQVTVPQRSGHVVSRELDGGVVVLNTVTDEAHHLDGDVAVVWRGTADGVVAGLDAESVARIVDELSDRGLLAPATGAPSRRSMLRAGAAGGAALATAGIQTIALPTAAFAASNDLPYQAPGPGTQTINVPAYVNTISFTLIGGGGGGATASRRGGDAASLDGKITLPSGRTGPTLVTISVGAGGSASGAAGGGFRNGGAGGAAAGGGGGASAIEVDGVVVVIAAGGGGSGAADGTTPGGRGGHAGFFSGAAPVTTVNVGNNGANFNRDPDVEAGPESQGGRGGGTTTGAGQDPGLRGRNGNDGGAAGTNGSPSGNGGAGGSTAGFPGGGGGGGGWAGGGGGQAGGVAVDLVSAGAGGGGGSSMFRNTGSFVVEITAAGQNVGSGGAIGANGDGGSALIAAV